MKTKIILIAVVLTAILGAFYLGQNRGVRVTQQWYADHMDTTSVTQIDTNIDNTPKPDTVYLAGKPVPYPVYVPGEAPAPEVIVKDSIVYMMLPRVVKEYKTEDYLAKVSGVEPNLDYIETYNKTITNTVYVPQKITPKKNYFSLDAKFMLDKYPMAPVTMNIGYTLGMFDVYAGGGYDFLQKGMVLQAGVSAKIRFE